MKLFLAYDHFLPNFAQIDQIFLLQRNNRTAIFNTSFNPKSNAEFKSFYRIQFAFHVLKLSKF
jgi:hypothetical protein